MASKGTKTKRAPKAPKEPKAKREKQDRSGYQTFAFKVPASVLAKFHKASEEAIGPRKLSAWVTGVVDAAAEKVLAKA